MECRWPFAAARLGFDRAPVALIHHTLNDSAGFVHKNRSEYLNCYPRISMDYGIAEVLFAHPLLSLWLRRLPSHGGDVSPGGLTGCSDAPAFCFASRVATAFSCSFARSLTMLSSRRPLYFSATCMYAQ